MGERKELFYRAAFLCALSFLIGCPTLSPNGDQAQSPYGPDGAQEAQDDFSPTAADDGETRVETDNDDTPEPPSRPAPPARAFAAAPPSSETEQPQMCAPANALPVRFSGSQVDGCGGPVRFSYGRRCTNLRVSSGLRTALSNVISPCVQQVAGGCRSLNIVHMGVSRRPGRGAPSCHHTDSAIDISGIQCDGKSYTALRDKGIFRALRGCVGAHGLPTVFDNASHRDHLHISAPGCGRNPGVVVRGRGLRSRGVASCTNPDPSRQPSSINSGRTVSVR